MNPVCGSSCGVAIWIMVLVTGTPWDTVGCVLSPSETLHGMAC